MKRGRSYYSTTIKNICKGKPNPERIESRTATFFNKLLSSSFERLDSPVCPKISHFF
jgi:hypothetical protein